MDPKIINQEILLSTGAIFCSRSFRRNKDYNGGESYSSIEELEKACWGGVLHEMLPELFDSCQQRSNNYVWNTASGLNSFCVTMSPYPMLLEKQLRLTPISFYMKPVGQLKH